MIIQGPEETISRLLETVSKPARILILLAIGRGEACVCHLEAMLGLRQAYISQHLMAMRKAGLLKTRRQGKYIFYQMRDERLLGLIYDAGAIARIPQSHMDRLTQTQPIPQCCCPHCLQQVKPLPDRSESPIIKMGKLDN
jgi:DNA-binding transcriptional ArsR family regulator